MSYGINYRSVKFDLIFPYSKADGSKLPKDRAFIKSGNLTIKSIRKEDHGKYECVLENIIATLVTTTTLRVDSKPNIPKTYI